MSGDGSDAGNYATWSFSTGSVTSGTCRISVHVPASSDIRHVGGSPSYYTVHAGSSSSGARLASFTIDQVNHQGQWVAAPNVKINGGGWRSCCTTAARTGTPTARRTRTTRRTRST